MSAGAGEKTYYGSLAPHSGVGKATRKPRVPPAILVHGALVVVFVAFGGGSFISKFGIRGASPLLFELVREAVVAPLFLIVTRATSGRIVPDMGDWPKVLLLALLFSASQACFFLGLKHENPNVGSTWQAALPIFTTLFAVCSGQEQVHLAKVGGIFLASGGAMWMTLAALVHSSSGSTVRAGGSWLSRIDGHILFFGQAICNSLYIVFSKPIVKKYGGLSLNSWTWGLGGAILCAFVFSAKASPGLSLFVCEDPVTEIKMQCAEAILQIPSSMIWPLVYEVLVCSVVAWRLLAWCLQYATSSVVSVYTVIQPCTTCLLSLMAVGLKGKTWCDLYGIQIPGISNVLGGLLIVIGLWVMLNDEVFLVDKEEQPSGQSERAKGP